MATAQQSGADSEAPSALADALAQIVRRLKRLRWLRLASRGALAAACLSLIAVGLARAALLPARMPLELVIPILLLLGLGIGTLLAVPHPADAMTAARLAETRLGLKERLSSALEFERAGMPPPDPELALLLRLQRQDAAVHAQALHPADAVPFRMPWETKAFLAAFFLLLLVLVLPALPVFVPSSVRIERAVVKASGEELVRTARVIEKRADTQNLPATRRAAQNMQTLGRRMAQGRMDKKQAMVQMSGLSRQMADAQSGGAAGQGSKALAQAGRQLAQSLSQSPAGQGPKPAGGTSGKSAAPHPRPAGSGAQKPASPGGHGQASASDPEMQKAARSLQQGDVPGLSEQLRNLARRTASRPASPDEQRQAAQGLQKLSDALQGTPLSDTRRHAQSAADALKGGDPQRAAREMQQAADAADRQAKSQQDAQGVADAQGSLQAGQQRMARASTPADIPPGPSPQGASGSPSDSAGSRGPGGQNPPSRTGSATTGRAATPGLSRGQAGAQGQNNSGGSPQSGAPGNSGSGIGRSSAAQPGSNPRAGVSDTGGQTPSQNAGVVRGRPHPLDPKFDPTKNPQYGKIYLGTGNGASGGGKWLLGRPGASPSGEPGAGSVPYGKALAPARKTAETAMDKEDIPPAYRRGVRQYFDSLQPPAAKTSK